MPEILQHGIALVWRVKGLWLSLQNFMRRYHYPAKGIPALRGLLLDMFLRGEFKLFIIELVEFEPAIVHHLPGCETSDFFFVEETLGLLRRHGYIDEEFFSRLVACRFRRRREILDVQRRFCRPSLGPGLIFKWLRRVT